MKRFISKFSKKAIALGSIVVLSLGLVTPATTTVQAKEAVLSTADKTVKLDPSYQQESFDGWGTALVWFANVTGGWPDEIRTELADALFGEDGLNLNIARYNIGGGDAPETEPYMRPGGAVPGYWNRPVEFDPPEDADEDWEEQEDWWNPDDPDHWNWDADANQQWWLEAAKAHGADKFEAFANSPPYFMTQSGYTSGNWDSTQDNIQADKYVEFSTYLTRVVNHLQDDLDIEIQTLSPVNEPNTNYWGAQGRQEGAHWDPSSQAKIINEVAKRIEELNLDTVISAMDETNPSTFRGNWSNYDTATKENVGQMNVHTYGTGGRTAVRDLAKIEDKRLWMSEVDLGPSGIPQDFDNIEPGLALSERITSDITNLEPSAWVLWQAIEDQVNMNAENENMNWGLIHVDFQPENFEGLEWHKNKKYYAMGNYTKFIRPGHHIINSDSSDTLAAMDKEGDKVVVVYTNQSNESEVVDFDLSGFETIGESASATPYVTSGQDNIAQKEAIAVTDDRLSATVGAKSITTFVISDVSGVENDASYLQEDKEFKIINKHSNKAMDLDEDGTSVVQNANNRNADNQEWSFRKVSDGYTNKETYKIISASGDVLTNDNGSAVLAIDENLDTQLWTLSTTSTEYTFINEDSGRLLEVGGQSTDDGASIGLWTANSGNNQAWYVVEAGVTSVESVHVWTTPGQAPVLPTKVNASYSDGETVEIEVEWDEMDAGQYAEAGEFVVEGTITDSSVKAEAIVSVSEIVSIVDEKVKTVPGIAPTLPTEVTANLGTGSQVTVPVSWDEMDESEYADLGQFTVTGSVEGTDVEAITYVKVAERANTNLALDANPSASFTGEWDSVDRINDGDYSSNRWTNWISGEWRASDWVALDFGEEKSISEVKFTFYDDEGGTRPPESLYLEYWDESEWVEIPGTQLDVEAEDEATLTFDRVTTSQVRVQMDAMPDTCIAIVEMEVIGIGDVPVSSSDASLSNILVTGEALADFDSGKLTYDVELATGTTEVPTVEVVPTDLFATYEVALPNDLPGDALVTVTSDDESTTETYTIHFTLENNDEIVDKAALSDKTKLAEELDEGSYTEASWSNLLTDLDNAQQVLDDASATQSEVDQAIDSLQTAMDSLVVIEDKEISVGETNQVFAGTTVSIENTDTKIKLPADLPEGTTLMVEKEELGNTSEQGIEIAGDVFTFTFSFPTGSESYTGDYLLTMGYDENDVESDEVAIYYFNESNENWENKGGKVEDGIIKLTVNHFSTYGVFAEVDTDVSDGQDGVNSGEEKEEITDQYEKNVEKGSGDELPETATSTYNFLVVGLLLLTSGATFIFIQRRKKV
ncbi:glycoside hydrolase [Aquibacillus rhizosphaerae]|uniref:Glycoside hydrolase n=1 Tax=Aquibacillus rhizosphaerae TaxID=3051431 RepID=A0ABT7LBC7_9BACI|nr:glycoside hydrolase [Aquibacillus sp. LR5S19]MDL4843161.1 glycoside hydrolase [Aquibacillus sp. LR5S19]